MSGEQIDIVLINDLSEIGRLGRELDCFAGRAGLSPKDLLQFNLILEEIVANIISYAYEDDRRHEIAVHAGLENRQLSIEVEDDGRPFNPLNAAPPDLHQPLEHKQVGGLGLHLVREMTFHLEYERKEGKNRLLMRKSLD